MQHFFFLIHAIETHFGRLIQVLIACCQPWTAEHGELQTNLEMWKPWQHNSHWNFLLVEVVHLLEAFVWVAWIRGEILTEANKNELFMRTLETGLGSLLSKEISPSNQRNVHKYYIIILKVCLRSCHSKPIICVYTIRGWRRCFLVRTINSHL